ncbi:hypothetical protein K0T92_23190 [Paenibacillus oenotherae]|uniref:YmcC n=1 Tax=Paenibacillus oenotherae TaxID=1435645 RepID=A0ABS7DCR9_9BACL|nr:hypothetical protein [Paenibacillus oenotherae]MBW7477630.1 hypothetical protein [Paenibacillus oenotherae]
MIGWLIVAGEAAFWLFVIGGLFARYVLRKEKLGALLLLGTPVIDILLILFTVIDLRNGAAASVFHGLAAIYVGVTVAFGRGMIAWADARFLYMFAGGPKPAGKPRYGKERAKRERTGWYKHLLAWALGSALLLGMIVLVNHPEQTGPLQQMSLLWAGILLIDFAISFSYTLWPKQAKDAAGE